MAFTQIKSKTKSFGRAPLTGLSVRTADSPNGLISYVAFGQDVLDAHGFKVGDRFDVLIGDGADEGLLIFRPGSTYSLFQPKAAQFASVPLGRLIGAAHPRAQMPVVKGRTTGNSICVVIPNLPAKPANGRVETRVFPTTGATAA